MREKFFCKAGRLGRLAAERPGRLAAERPGGKE
jgi:hypothetical protein